jgi:hypothetical protein
VAGNPDAPSEQQLEAPAFFDGQDARPSELELTDTVN